MQLHHHSMCASEEMHCLTCPTLYFLIINEKDSSAALKRNMDPAIIKVSELNRIITEANSENTITPLLHVCVPI